MEWIGLVSSMLCNGPSKEANKLNEYERAESDSTTGRLVGLSNDQCLRRWSKRRLRVYLYCQFHIQSFSHHHEDRSDNIDEFN
jgi:hypothetical protein